ncbi:MAG: nucleotidyl transferase AbiEii/AbiGii toxin family protein [Anaerolineae bacterium]
MYSSAGALRRALETRLNAVSRATGQPLTRLRKMVAFERLLARLAVSQHDIWMLKGGVAIQYRLGERARATLDMDLLADGPRDGIHATLASAGLMELGDWFQYLVGPPVRPMADDAGSVRFQIEAQLDGRLFETFHLDVGWGDPVLESADEIAAPSMLAFAGFEPVVFRCYPLSQHLAEKVHALTQPHASGASSRVKDLVDILLIADQSGLNAETIDAAIAATFEARRTHAQPSSLPQPPDNWGLPYQRLAAEVGLDETSLRSAMERARRFLDPVLQRSSRGEWDPRRSVWYETQ